MVYEEPDLTTPLSDLNRLGLDAAVRRLAAVLTAGITDYDATLDAKILGIALRLDPDSRPAREASERRKRGALTDPKQGALKYPAATVAGYLAGMSTGLRTKGGTDNLALAGFLSALAVDLDPANPAAKTEQDLVRRTDRPADLQRAIDLFATVQQSINPGALRLGAANANLVPTLKEILRLAPGHASAAAMLKCLEGWAPTTLSLRASLDELDRITDATLHAAKPEGQPSLDSAC